MSSRNASSSGRSPLDSLPRRILSGGEERIFSVLPPRVLENLRNQASENALLWNLIYPLARPDLSLAGFLSLRPLWGTAWSGEDSLKPYFWGFGLDGEPLEDLQGAVKTLGGGESTIEADLVLVGAANVVVVEAKHLGNPGRCGRYARGRCPEVHVENVPPGATCRYWEVAEASFSSALDFGPRPTPQVERPPCSAHYQLGRTLLLAAALGARLGLAPHLWLIVPTTRWRRLEAGWLDFAERVRNPEMWRRLRVLDWEAVRGSSA
jgi:hypothetical protein